MDESGFNYGNFSDTGKVREKNEDYFGTISTGHGILFIVCDGMGGHKGGQIASRLAVEVIRNSVINSNSTNPIELLEAAQKSANEEIRSRAVSDSELTGMGTTSVMLLLKPGNKPKAWISYVGDSRAYRIRQGKIEAITTDHSMVMEMVKHGIITMEQARTHPKKNVITQALGSKDTIKPDTVEIDVYRKDRFILCTDGLTDLVEDDEILKLSKNHTPQELPEKLVNLANEYGGIDNSTVQVIDIDNGPSLTKQIPEDSTVPGEPLGKIRLWQRLNKRIIPYIASITILIAGMLFMLFAGNSNLEADSKYSEIHNEHNQPMYEITITTDSLNMIKFDNPLIEQISDSTFTVLADDISSIADTSVPDSVFVDSVFLSYIVTSESDSDSLLDSILIENRYRPIVIPKLEVIESGIAVQLSVDSGTVLCLMDSQDSIPISSSGYTFEWQFPNPDSLVGLIKQNADSTITWAFSYSITNGTGNTYATSRLIEYNPPKIDPPIVTSHLSNHCPGEISIRGEVRNQNTPVYLMCDSERRDSTISDDTGRFIFNLTFNSGIHNITVVANPTNKLANETHIILSVLERPQLNNMGILTQSNGRQWYYIRNLNSIESYENADRRAREFTLDDGGSWHLPTVDEFVSLTTEFRLDYFGFKSVFSIPSDISYLLTSDHRSRFVVAGCISLHIAERILLESTGLLVTRN